MSRVLPLALTLMLIGMAAVSVAADAPAALPGKGIFTCRDKHGNPILRDRPIAECMDGGQDERNNDGSPRRQLAPPPTPDEAAARDAEAQRMRDAKAAHAEAARFDRLLLVRYPDEEAHERARQAALDVSRGATKGSEKRLEELQVERRRLDQEAEFYKGRSMPDKLRQDIANNSAAVNAQRQSMANQTSEMQRINQKFDAVGERLRKLWKGALPGSVGPVPAADR